MQNKTLAQIDTHGKKVEDLAIKIYEKGNRTTQECFEVSAKAISEIEFLIELYKKELLLKSMEQENEKK